MKTQRMLLKDTIIEPASGKRDLRRRSPGLVSSLKNRSRWPGFAFSHSNMSGAARLDFDHVSRGHEHRWERGRCVPRFHHRRNENSGTAAGTTVRGCSISE